jgi:sporulation protein YlmC with PRC-barrel domain
MTQQINFSARFLGRISSARQLEVHLQNGTPYGMINEIDIRITDDRSQDMCAADNAQVPKGQGMRIIIGQQASHRFPQETQDSTQPVKNPLGHSEVFTIGDPINVIDKYQLLHTSVCDQDENGRQSHRRRSAVVLLRDGFPFSRARMHR